MLLDGEYIEIQGDVARIIERRVVRQVPLTAALERLETRNSFSFPTLGRTQVFGHHQIDNGIKRLFALTEIPAGIRSITKNLRDRVHARRYRLAMPWTYLWFVCEASNNGYNDTWNISDYSIFHAPQRYMGPDDEMIVARLPNVYNDGRICWGATGVNPDLPLADRLDQLTNEWYASTFNADLDGSVPLPQNEPNYRRWVTESAANPMCWRNWPEWTDPNVPKISVTRLLRESAGFTGRLPEIRLADSIPEIPVRLTFGNMEEWWRELTPAQRTQARTSLNNLEFDEPDSFEEVIVNPPTDNDDDGGIEVERR